MYIRVQVPEPQHKMSILRAKSSPQQTLNFGIHKVSWEASFLFGTVDFILQSRLIFGHAREYSQPPSLFPPISIRSHLCLSLPQVSLLLSLLLPSPLSSPVTWMPVSIIVFLLRLIPRPKVEPFACLGGSLCISAYLANNVDTTLSNKKARMVWAMSQR